uniref:HECT-type E3 ubiquitin transferase n=1 Tax=Emiliania huxleyi (strain CCMP1516) TaxID=280463 RepID=A0A0D3JRF2_EMIH1
MRREHLLEDGYVQLGALPREKLKGTIRVEFVSELGLAEAGIDRTGVCKEPLEDAAGVFKEFLEDAMRAAIDPQRGLFARTAQRRIYPSPSSGVAEHVPDMSRRLLGKAVYEGIVLDAALADFFAAKLLGKPGSIDDLASLDPELFQSLQLVKSYDGDVEGDLCLCFTVDEDVFGVRTAVDLREGGSTMPVTRENRIEYVHLMADYRLNRQIEAQSRAFVAGVHSVVPLSWLRLFTTPELQRLINGDDAPIDVNDLRRHTRYAGGYNELTPTVRDLWRVVADFSHEDRALLLKFVTSCSKPPLLGFKYLQPPFTVQNETQRLPTASTCFNLLKLPNFKSRAVLRERLLYAIRSASGFELS